MNHNSIIYIYISITFIYNMNRYKIKEYSDRDPRYNFTIEDSDEYTKNIYPLLLKKKCNNTKEFEEYLRNRYPPIARCWGERYENCADLSNIYPTESYKRHGKACACSRCRMGVYTDVESTVTWEDLKDFNPKKLNKNNFYDQGWIRKDNPMNLVVDNRSPDTCQIDKHREHDRIDRIEGFDLIETCTGSCANICGELCSGYVDICGSIIKGVCNPCCPDFLSAEEALSICCTICLFIICLPCIISLIRR